MNLLRKEEAQSTGVDITTYMPIVQSLSSISEQECQKLRIKFYIAYLLPQNNQHIKNILSFVNYKQSLA